LADLSLWLIKMENQVFTQFWVTFSFICRI
jgi:hypothetical protein